MGRVARFAQAADDPVRMDVDRHAGEEDGRSGEELRREQPLVRVVAFRRDVKYPAALHAGVQQVECDAHGDDAQRHRATALEQHRVDEGPVQIVELEQGEKDQRGRFVPSRRAQTQRRHGQKYGGLHQDPSDPVVDFRAPAAVA